MANEEEGYLDQFLGDVNLRIRDLEERQRILKDRLLLIGQNLIETKEKNIQDMLETKKTLEFLNQDMIKLRNFFQHTRSYAT